MYRIIVQVVCSFIISPSTPSFPLLLHTLVVINEPILIHYHYLQSTVCIKVHTSCYIFLWVFKNADLFTWLYQGFAAVCRIFSCGMQTLSCSMWGLVPWPGIEPRPLALRVQSQPVDHQGSSHSMGFDKCIISSINNYTFRIVSLP